jgi:transposase-like protein
MAYPDYIREKAIQMRVERDLTMDEIAERLAIPRTTVYYWVRDIPLAETNTKSRKLAQIRAGEATSAKHRRLREGAYALGAAQFDRLATEPTFRDFVALCVAEGLKRNRNRVEIGNSDYRILAVASGWLRRLSDGKLTYRIQYHVDQDLHELRAFWGAKLGVDASVIRLQRKSNSNHLTGRTWRSEHGVLTISAADTLLRARLQAWMDRIRSDWTLDSAGPRGV